jgi:hypothetical protein
VVDRLKGDDERRDLSDEQVAICLPETRHFRCSATRRGDAVEQFRHRLEILRGVLLNVDAIANADREIDLAEDRGHLSKPTLCALFAVFISPERRQCVA